MTDVTCALLLVPHKHTCA